MQQMQDPEVSLKAVLGHLAAVRGTVLEVEIEVAPPPVSTALECVLPDGQVVTAVVQAYVGATRLRAIALDSTQRLRLGAQVRSDGLPLTVPVGRGLLGRVVDLHGNPLDGGPAIVGDTRRPLRRPPPSAGNAARTLKSMRRASR